MEKLLHLFNTLWFERGVLSERSESPEKMPTDSVTGHGPSSDLDRPALKISHVRSSSDQLILSSNINLMSDADSPKSVLRPTAKLQTILSGIDVGEFEAGEEEKVVKKMKVVGRGRGRSSRRSKSLTELEFEEVKGFMDLGFVFSEEDHKDSSLVSMIPGLQRLSHQNTEEDGVCLKGEGLHQTCVSRPYLSEAWRSERKQKKPSRVNLRVASMADELEMKNQIKFWAHSVAFAVR